MSYRIEEVAFEDLPEDELAEILALVNRGSHEESPRHVNLTLDEFRMFSTGPGFIQRRFRVVDETGRVVAFSNTRYHDDGSDPEVLMCQIRVDAEVRRQGIGTLLLGNAIGVARSLGRNTLQLYHYDTVPAAAAFIEVIGAKPVLQMHVNTLKLDDLDVELMNRWANEGPSKAPGYRADLYEGRWPEEILEGMARLYFILDRDSPQAEGHEPREWTADLIRQFLDTFMAGVDSLMALAVHEESGVPVGMSQLIRRRTDLSKWIVTTTMVDPDHRGKSLGRWIKGVVNLAALDRWEGGVYQETANAQINAPMLAINHEMGFEHEYTFFESEVSVDRASEFVAARQN